MDSHIFFRFAQIKLCKEVNNMSNSNNNSSSKKSEAMNRFKQECANEVGVNLKSGYNGDLTSREAGSIGGEMVKKMIKRQEEQMQ